MNQDLLHKYFKGETSVDEEKRILNWDGRIGRKPEDIAERTYAV